MRYTLLLTAIATALFGCLLGSPNYAEYQSSTVSMCGSGSSVSSNKPLTIIGVDVAGLRDSGRELEFRLAVIGRNESPRWRTMNTVDEDELIADGWQPQPTRGDPAIVKLYNNAGVVVRLKDGAAVSLWAQYSSDYPDRTLSFRQRGQTRVVRLPMSKSDADYLSGEVGKLVISSVL